MAAGAFDDSGVPSPEREVKNPPPNPHTDLYAVRKFSDIEIAMNKSFYATEALKDKIDAQTSHIEKLLEKTHQVDLKIVEIDTKLTRVIADYGALDAKLDKVRTWVISAAAIVTVLALIVPSVIAKLPWFGPAPAPPAETGKPARR